MEKLVRGVHDFQVNYFQPRKALFAEVAREQRPEVMFISCSDSRVSPTLMTQSEPGDVFVLRNAGNIAPEYGKASGGEAATIEYAIRALEVKHIVVCGHTKCGAMSALLHPEQVSDLPAVAGWLDHASDTRRIVDANYSHLDDDARHLAAIEENVLVQLEHLLTHPSVAEKVAQGEVELHGWVYNIESASVVSFDPRQRQYLPLVSSLERSARI